jgi:hypothetical protein
VYTRPCTFGCHKVKMYKYMTLYFELPHLTLHNSLSDITFFAHDHKPLVLPPVRILFVLRGADVGGHIRNDRVLWTPWLVPIGGYMSGDLDPPIYIPRSDGQEYSRRSTLSTA